MTLSDSKKSSQIRKSRRTRDPEERVLDGGGWPHLVSRVAVRGLRPVVAVDVGDTRGECYPCLFSLTSCAMIFRGYKQAKCHCSLVWAHHTAEFALQ